MALNVITVTFGPGMKVARTKKRTRGDYGQYLDIKGLDGILPSVFEVHFSNTKENAGTAKPQIGQDGRVQIPYEYLNTGRTVYGWIFLHEGENDGTSEYIVIIENNSKPTVVDVEPTPDEEPVISQLIGAMNTAVAKTAEDVTSADASAHAAAQSATDAQTAAQSAQGSATSASGSASTASTAAATATTKASEAATSAANAAQSAANASRDANRAEQAAGRSGYMRFYIDENGHLHYQRTSNVQVDFYLEDGHLYVRASA